MRFKAEKFEIRNVTKDRKLRVPLILTGDLAKKAKLANRLVGKKWDFWKLLTLNILNLKLT